MRAPLRERTICKDILRSNGGLISCQGEVVVAFCWLGYVLLVIFGFALFSTNSIIWLVGFVLK